MNPDHLIELAGQIVQIGAAYPKQATLNRAISTAYYGLFHALCRDCVARTVGSPRSPRYWEIVTPIYRAIEHASARKVFERLVRDPASSEPLKQIGLTFVELQAARIAADYDPASRYTRKEALDLIGQASNAVAALKRLARDERVLLAVQLISKQR